MTGTAYVKKIRSGEARLWPSRRPALTRLDIELTERCNNDCVHCSVNRPAGDRESREREWGAESWKKLLDEAAALGCLVVRLTGGEPLLRDDFEEIYIHARRLGLRVMIFTNATLVTEEHVRFFKKFPPRDIEVTVYGVTKETYERVTRTPGSYDAFRRGLDRLLQSGARVRLKAMALRSNKHEIAAIGEFCRARTKDYYRFDPHLHLRFDRDEVRNSLILAERLTSKEVARLERSDPERFSALTAVCDELIAPAAEASDCRHIFRCGVGQRSFVIGPEGLLRPCLSLHHPDFLYDLKKGSLAGAWTRFVPEVLKRETNRREYLEKCGACPVVNLCLWCPAHAYLETGELDLPVEAFCRIAHARAEGLNNG
jgi:radical SAM protein with 4Fe4S-binding SPASM domain